MRARKQHGSEYDAHRALKETPKMRTYTTQTRSTNHAMLYVVLTVVALLLAAAAIGGFRDDTLLLEQKQYCQMVYQWKQSGGEVGWPDYDKAYDVACNANGTVKAEG
jgi:hypothetical protein